MVMLSRFSHGNGSNTEKHADIFKYFQYSNHSCALQLLLVDFVHVELTARNQSAFTCSNSTMERSEKCVKSVQS